MGSERPERKLAAIFCADVAGYSRLTGQDEEGTHRILSARLDGLTAAIERHGGKVLHYAGDAVLPISRASSMRSVAGSMFNGTSTSETRPCPRSAGRNLASASIWVTSSLDTGATFSGPRVHLAFVVDDPEVRRQALAEGRERMAKRSYFDRRMSSPHMVLWTSYPARQAVSAISRAIGLVAG